VVVTELDHAANFTPSVSLAERGVEICIGPLNVETFDIYYDVLGAHLAAGRVRWVACRAASNAIGTMSDLSRVLALANGADAKVYLDGVQRVPHVVTAVDVWGVDALACSAYKFCGPSFGVLWARRGILS
jgi:selenocysteine lyase/cysteine desulfurase